jgi:hypothetical protein
MNEGICELVPVAGSRQSAVVIYLQECGALTRRRYRAASNRKSQI